jgi:hypothetical protein
MAATVIRELPGTGEFDGATFTNTFTRSYLVELDIGDNDPWPADAEFQAITATGLPSLYDQYATGVFAYAMKARASAWDWPASKKHLRVDVEYMPSVRDGNTGMMVGDTTLGTPTGPGQLSATTPPDERPLTVEPFVRTGTRPIITGEDLAGDPLVNTAGQPLTGITVPHSTLGAALATCRSLINKVNDASFMGFPANTLKITSIIPRPTWIHDAYYSKMEVEIEINSDDSGEWIPTRVLNAGKLQIVGGKFTDCVGIDGTPVSDPVPLGVTGLQSNPGDALTFLEFVLYEQADFELMYS